MLFSDYKFVMQCSTFSTGNVYNVADAQLAGAIYMWTINSAVNTGRTWLSLYGDSVIINSAAKYSQVQSSTVKYSQVQPSTAKYSQVQHCITLHCIALHCIALHCIALHCIALHCIALHCIAVQCSAVQCSTVQYSTVQYSTVVPHPFSQPHSYFNIVYYYYINKLYQIFIFNLFF